MPNHAPADRQTLEAATARGPLALGSVVVARRPTPETRAGRGGGAPNAEFVALYLPRDDAPDRAGEAYIAHGGLPSASLEARDCVVLLAPHRFLASVLPTGRTPGRLPRSIALRVLQRYLDGLLDLEDDRLCDRQADLAAAAVRSLLAAALLPAGAGQGLGSRRRSSLLEDVTAHIDADLRAPLSPVTLCAALKCSRSALYRATAASGGVAELVLHRRLIAIRDRLLDPQERRPIAALAEAHGFTDTAQFNRRFKALFGAPPGEVRRGAAERRAGLSHRRELRAPIPARRPIRLRP